MKNILGGVLAIGGAVGSVVCFGVLAYTVSPILFAWWIGCVIAAGLGNLLIRL